MRKELVEKRNDMITRCEQILNGAKEEKRELTEDEAAELAEIRDNVRKLLEMAQLEKYAEELTEKEEPKEDDNMNEETRTIEQREYDQFDAYLRGTYNERSGELSPAQGSGQVIIPKTIADRIVTKVYEIAPVLERATRYNVRGNLDIPVWGDTAGQTPDNITVAYATEFSALTSHSGAFTTVSLTGFVAGALTKVSRSLINNAAFDVVGFVVDEMARAIARFIEGELIHGTNNKVAGLAGGVTKSVTTAAAAAITADEVIKLHDAIADAYQANAMWIMSPATRTALRQLKAQYGGYLLNDDISTPFGVTLLGKPVYVSDNMDDIAAGKTTIYYGDMRGLAVKFAEDINIEVLRERYADEHAVGVIGWLEFDAKVADAGAIAKLVQKAS